MSRAFLTVSMKSNKMSSLFLKSRIVMQQNEPNSPKV